VRVLVTGGAGFIGSHVVTRLLAAGRDVRVLDNMSTGRRSNLSGVAGEFELIRADVRDLPVVQEAMRGCGAVVHLAALPSVPRSIDDPAATHDANATGTLHVLLAARDAGVSRVVFASSSSIYGAVAELPKRESLTPLPISPYAVSKLAAEHYCRSFFEVFGLETVALRYFNVFGPRQDAHSVYAAVIPRFIHAYREGTPPVIFGDGEQSRDFTYVDDVAEANLAALGTAGVGGRVYNVACGTRVTLNELAVSIRRETGATVAPVHSHPRPGEVRHSVADVSRARQELGYEPVVTLDEGLRRTVEHSANGHAAASDVPAVRLNGGVRRSSAARSGRRRARRYLITGGAGFIGSHLVDGLRARDPRCEVVVLDDLSTGRLENIAHALTRGGIEFVNGSAADAALVDALMPEADVCVHLASPVGVQMIVDEPLGTLMRSVRATNVVMRAAVRHGVRVLFSSTSEVYGKHTSQALDEEDNLILGSPSKARWSYAIAKEFGEALVHGYHGGRDADATVVRLFNTVGARQTGQYGMVLPRFVRQALGGRDLTVYGDGEQTRCFTHVRDTVDALMLLCECNHAHGRTFNVGSSTPVAVIDLARRVIARVESDSAIMLVPYDEAYGDGFEELGTRRPTTAALHELTGWEPRRTVDDAIDDVIAHERGREEAESELATAAADVA
jgi:nucleoside-diphosphate-sugar epimerase